MRLTRVHYLAIQEVFVTTVVDNKVRAALLDLRDFKYPIAPALQEEVANKNFPRAIAAGLRKIAIVNSSLLTVQVSSEQLMEEDKDAVFQTQYFNDLDSAYQWLAV
ncbi:MAG: hypothetical protein JJT94_04425 [Bernardetiaceae bacterium]|nr:hypothetical protein [Bernardetiaceae bacterium]